MIVENYYRKNVKKSLEGKKKVLPLHPLSGTERKFNLKTINKFIEKTEGSTTSTENEKRALILFFRRNEVVGVELEI